MSVRDRKNPHTQRIGTAEDQSIPTAIAAELAAAGAIIAFVVMIAAAAAPAGFVPQTLRLLVWFVGLTVLVIPCGAFAKRRLSPSQPMLPRAGLFVMGALFVDGLLVGFLPQIYEQQGDSLTGLGALLLWGVALTIASAYIADRRCALPDTTRNHTPSATSDRQRPATDEWRSE